jgi:hypothetical protein
LQKIEEQLYIRDFYMSGFYSADTCSIPDIRLYSGVPKVISPDHRRDSQ